MGDKARHRTRDWQRQQIDHLITALARSAVEELNFKRLKALGIIKKAK